MKDKEQCCSNENMSPEEEKAACANEILAAKDSSGMDLKQAEQVLGDQSAAPEQKEMAESMLAAADSSGLDEQSAEEAIATCESNKQQGMQNQNNKSNAA